MNEIQIIHTQLATERQHFAAVAEIASRSDASRATTVACAEYLAYAATRLDAETSRKLAAQLAAGLGPDFLQAFIQASSQHFAKLDGLLARNLPVTEWRALAGIDADSIFAERTLYARVQATLAPK